MSVSRLQYASLDGIIAKMTYAMGARPARGYWARRYDWATNRRKKMRLPLFGNDMVRRLLLERGELGIDSPRYGTLLTPPRHGKRAFSERMRELVGTRPPMPFGACTSDYDGMTDAEISQLQADGRLPVGVSLEMIHEARRRRAEDQPTR